MACMACSGLQPWVSYRLGRWPQDLHPSRHLPTLHMPRVRHLNLICDFTWQKRHKLSRQLFIECLINVLRCLESSRAEPIIEARFSRTDFSKSTGADKVCLPRVGLHCSALRENILKLATVAVFRKPLATAVFLAVPLETRRTQ